MRRGCHVRQTMACGGSLTGRGPAGRVDDGPRARSGRGGHAACGSGRAPLGRPHPQRPALVDGRRSLRRCCAAGALAERTALAAANAGGTGGGAGATGPVELLGLVRLHRGAAGGAAPGRRRRPGQPVGDQERTGLSPARRRARRPPWSIARQAGSGWRQIDPGCIVMLPADVLVARRAGAEIALDSSPARGRRADRVHLGHHGRAQGRRPHPWLAVGGGAGAAARRGIGSPTTG